MGGFDLEIFIVCLDCRNSEPARCAAPRRVALRHTSRFKRIFASSDEAFVSPFARGGRHGGNSFRSVYTSMTGTRHVKMDALVSRAIYPTFMILLVQYSHRVLRYTYRCELITFVWRLHFDVALLYANECRIKGIQASRRVFIIFSNECISRSLACHDILVKLEIFSRAQYYRGIIVLNDRRILLAEALHPDREQAKYAAISAHACHCNQTSKIISKRQHLWAL